MHHHGRPGYDSKGAKGKGGKHKGGLWKGKSDSRKGKGKTPSPLNLPKAKTPEFLSAASYSYALKSPHYHVLTPAWHCRALKSEPLGLKLDFGALKELQRPNGGAEQLWRWPKVWISGIWSTRLRNLKGSKDKHRNIYSIYYSLLYLTKKGTHIGHVWHFYTNLHRLNAQFYIASPSLSKNMSKEVNTSRRTFPFEKCKRWSGSPFSYMALR